MHFLRVGCMCEDFFGQHSTLPLILNGDQHYCQPILISAHHIPMFCYALFASYPDTHGTWYVAG